MSGGEGFRLDGVQKSFADLRVLDGVSLEAKQGEFVALVGPSGCGKSTALRMCSGLEQADSGRVLWKGEPVVGTDPARMLLFQEHALYPWRTVAQNVGLGLEMAGVSRAEREERVAAILGRVGLGGFGPYLPHQLSGGMKQRAAIARALVMDPAALLLDEPYGALDAITRLTMQEELLRLWHGTGKTVLLVTHDIDEALFLADRIYVMSPRPGRVVRELLVGLDRPRNRSGSRYVELRAEVLDALTGSTLDPVI